jgi:hypothetical protein
MSYAVCWCENAGPACSGRLSIDAAGVELSGTAPDGPPMRCGLPFAELTGVHVERAARLRRPWRPSLVLVTRAGDQIEIGSLQGPGSLHELAEEVARRCGKAAT